jgi:hypothetical protein
MSLMGRLAFRISGWGETEVCGVSLERQNLVIGDCEGSAYNLRHSKTGNEACSPQAAR